MSTDRSDLSQVATSTLTRLRDAIAMGRVSFPITRASLLDHGVRRGTIVEAGAAVRVPYDALLIDDEGGRPVAPLGVDSHLKCHAVHGADRQ